MLKFRLDESDIERFNRMVDRDGPTIREELGPCWVWTGSTTQFGHGQFLVRLTESRMSKKYSGHGAHRIAWSIANNGKAIPDGLLVRHRCDNPPCVRPSHLELGTFADNMRDMYERGRAMIGERHGSAKLTDANVLAICADFAQNGTAIQELARRFGVTDMTVHDILKGRAWRHITGGDPVQPPAELSPEERARRAAVAGPRNAIKGEASHKARLTADQVRQLCSEHLAGEGPSELAARYDISPTAVLLILRGKNWASVTGGKNIYVSHKKRLTEFRRAEALRLCATMSNREIAEHLGITYQAVDYLIRTAPAESANERK